MSPNSQISELRTEPMKSKEFLIELKRYRGTRYDDLTDVEAKFREYFEQFT